MKNLVEQAVREMHAGLVAANTEFCACSRCADDVLAMVMNKTKPRYTTTGLGFAIEHADLVSNQTRAELSVLVFDAMRRVAQRPRHTPPTSTEAQKG